MYTKTRVLAVLNCWQVKAVLYWTFHEGGREKLICSFDVDVDASLILVALHTGVVIGHHNANMHAQAMRHRGRIARRAVCPTRKQNGIPCDTNGK